jgi:molecular chaperone HscC
MIVGIDLGTTNSLIAVWQDGAARLIPNRLGDVMTPSCVSLDEDGAILVGRAARDRLQTHPGHSAAAFKRHMGSAKSIKLGERSFRPEELSALILRALKDDAEAALGVPVTEAIITVPAYFSDAQRKATRVAGQLAGLTVERLLNEPTAAALAYGVHLRGSESKFLVFDLGGGTFDVSVLDLFDNVMEVRASGGDNLLGGEDFVACLVDLFFDSVKLPARYRDEPVFMQRLSAQVELAKRTLSDAPRALVTVYDGDTEFALELDHAMLERACAPLLARLRAPVGRVLRDAGMQSEELDNIVLAGGATRMPAVRRMVEGMFGRAPACGIDPDQVVALGAAVQAGLRANDAALGDVVMTDVTPYSLGIDVALRMGEASFSHGHFDAIIARNSVVPISRVQHYIPVADYQAQLELNVYQGESRRVDENILLGTLHVPLPRGPREECGVDVRFTYDVSGVLQVEVMVPSSGQTMALIIENNPGVLSDEEIAASLASLAALKIHPRDNIAFRSAAARGDRLHQQLRGAARERLAAQMASFDVALASQDRRQCELARKALENLLDAIEQDDVLAPDSEVEERAAP